MGNEAPSEILARRKLLGRSAALAGTAAAGAIALGIAGSRPAAAENGDPFVMGFRGNRVHTPTGLTYAKGEDPSSATLILENPDGPALHLLPVPEGSQDVKEVPFGSDPGCFFATLERPVFSAGAEGQSFPVGLATLDDVDVIEQPNVSVAQRILDTTKNFPGTVADAGSLDASGRLKAGRSIDLQVSPTLYPDADLDIPAMSAVFLNVHSSGSTANGILSVCLPDQSKQATLHFTKGVTVANFTVSPVVQLIRPGNDGFPAYFVRIYASATTHVQVDLLGTISSNLDNRPGAGLPHRTKRRSAARRITNKLKSPR